MNILWFTWKDRKNPQAGGAELENEELAKRLVRDGHTVIFIVGGFAGGKNEEVIDGFRVIRLGNRYSLYLKAHAYYKANLTGWASIIIDEINTMPFLVQLYAKEKRVLYINQLCREIWFYQMSFPLSVIGYIIEPLYLRLLNKNKVIAISTSTKTDLLNYGFRKKNISIIPMGIDIDPIDDVTKVRKFNNPTLLSLGTIRPMKRTIDQLKAFEIAKTKIKNLKFIVVGQGEGKYFQKFQNLIKNSKYAKDIKYMGKVSLEEKKSIMQKSHLISITSVKEGWGLIATEANSQGTVAVSYNVDGLRDSVRNNITGLVTTKENTPKELAKRIVSILKDKKKYQKMRITAWEESKKNTFENSYKEFLSQIESI